MLKYNFIYEPKMLLQNRWIQLFSVLLFNLFCFLGYTRQKKITKRTNGIAFAKADIERNPTFNYQRIQHSSITLLVFLLTSIELFILGFVSSKPRRMYHISNE